MYLAMLLLDEASTLKMRGYWRVLKEAGLPTLNETWEPHISLAAFTAPNEAQLLKDVAGASRGVERFELRFDALGTFPRGVVYAAPTPTARLLELQTKLYQVLNVYAQFDKPFYTPGRWTPHCSLLLNASRREVMTGLELLLRDWQPITAAVRGLTLVRVAADMPNAPGHNVLYRGFHTGHKVS